MDQDAVGDLGLEHRREPTMDVVGRRGSRAARSRPLAGMAPHGSSLTDRMTMSSGTGTSAAEAIAWRSAPGAPAGLAPVPEGIDNVWAGTDAGDVADSARADREKDQC